MQHHVLLYTVTRNAARVCVLVATRSLSSLQLYYVYSLGKIEFKSKYTQLAYMYPIYAFT